MTMETSTIPASTPGAPSPSALLESGFVISEPWVDDALCAQTYPDAFFPDSETAEGSTAKARSICGSCLVPDECLAYALAHDERYGIWGGLTSSERRRIKPFPRKEPSPLCQRGHDRTPANTRRTAAGTLVCTICEQEPKQST